MIDISTYLRENKAKLTAEISLGHYDGIRVTITPANGPTYEGIDWTLQGAFENALAPPPVE